MKTMMMIRASAKKKTPKNSTIKQGKKKSNQSKMTICNQRMGKSTRKCTRIVMTQMFLTGKILLRMSS
jgi:hypothetical protein